MKKAIGLAAAFVSLLLWAPTLAAADTPPPPTSRVVSAVTADGRPYTSGTWTNQDVTVTLECTTDGVEHTHATTWSTEFPGASVSLSCMDKESRETRVTFYGIYLDKTLPVVTGVPAPGANDFGWNKTPVTVTFQCTDALSGVGSVAPPVTLATEGARQSALGSCTDKAGNSATATSPLVSIDLTPPVNTLVSVTPEPNAAGWNNTPVTVTTACSDALSGTIVTGSVVTLEGESANGGGSDTCYDRAGNSTTVQDPVIRLDFTPPAVSFSSPYTPGTWTNHDVTVDAACSDELSGVPTQPAGITFSNEASGGTYEVSCTDNAGNTATRAFGPVNIDKTAPTITASTGGYVPGTWTGQNVTVAFTCHDDRSGVAAVTAPVTFGTETHDGSATGTCTDAAGNTATATVRHIDVDKRPPALTLASDYTPGAWTSHDVAITATCSDDGSGVASAPADATLSSEGANQAYAASCTDAVGHTATATFGPVNIDKTAPTLTVSTGSYVPGTWTPDDVTATFACTDGLSGVAQVTAPFTFAQDVENGSAGGSCTDDAGNTAATTVDHVDVDKTPPTIAGAPSTTGWTNKPVTVTFTCADDGSGVATCTSPVTVSTEGAGQQVTGTAADNVGHTATTAVGGIDIDLTAPLLSFSGNQETYGILDTIAITCSANDFLSGIAASTCPTVNAPAWQYLGTHTLDASATDRAGNASSATATFTVVVRPDDLATFVQEVVTSSGIANALAGMIAKSNVNAFDHLVEAQRGKTIDPATADLLLLLASQL